VSPSRWSPAARRSSAASSNCEHDIVYEADLAYHDAAALVPILEGAGITVTDDHGRELPFGEATIDEEFRLLAAHPELHRLALERIRVSVVTREVEVPSSQVFRGYAAKFQSRSRSEGGQRTPPMDAITRLARPEILAMKPYSSARKEGEQDSIAIFLDANENPYPPFPGDPACEGLNRYPEPQPQHLLDLFAAHYQVNREQLLITRGADEAIDLLVRGFCAAGSDAIAINTPTFGMYEISAQIQGATVHAVPLRHDDGFQLDSDAILRVCRDDPASKLVFVCSPNNPTGALLRRDDILRLCAELLGHSLIVADETYIEFTDQPSLGAHIAEHPNLVVLRTLSKEYSLAGERCGITIAHPDVIGIIGRILAPYPLTASAIRTVARAMTPEAVQRARANMRRLVQQRQLLEQALRDSPAATRVYPSDTNYLLIQTPAPELLLEMMQRAGIKLRDRSKVPGIEGCVRLTVGTPEQNERVLKVFLVFLLIFGRQIIGGIMEGAIKG
jgi:histidinol-phosphate aminotransferase